MLDKNMLKQEIQCNYDMIRETENWIIEEHGIERRLRMLSFVSLMYATHVTGIYSSIFLEEEISKIAQSIKIEEYDVPKNGHILHVLTRGGTYGGHSALACNFVRWDKEHISSILFTDMNENEITDNFIETVGISGGEILALCGDYIDRAKQLARISKQYEAIVLHIHMNDVIPGLVYTNKNWKTPIFFCNHADFRFSLGFTFADRVLNITHFDIEKNVEYRGVERERNSFLFFPDISDIGAVKVDASIFEKYEIPKDKRIIVSMGADYKYHPLMGWNFYRFVTELLNIEQDAVFFVIGADPENVEWQKVNEKADGRLFATGILGPNEAESIISKADLYISSFPMVSSGAKVATKYNVPNLTFMITGRGREYFQNNIVDNIDELLTKSVEILRGDSSTFKSQYSDCDFSHHKWSQAWNEIFESTKEHNTYAVSPRRLIGQQEYIDFEMMERDATGWLVDFLWSNREDYRLLENVYSLQEKWGKQLIPSSYINRINREAAIQNKLYRRMLKWNRIFEQCEYSISKYFEEIGEKRIVIYGYGEVGRLLLDELKCSPINVICCVDRNKNGKNCPIELLTVDQYEKRYEGELIINTTVFDDEVIQREFSMSTVRIISIDKVLDIISGERY